MRNRVGQFIRRFRDYAELPQSVEEISELALHKAIELVNQNTNAEDNKYGESLRQATSLWQVRRLIARDYGAYTAYMSGLIVVLDELTKDAQWTPEQKQLINGLLDKLDIFHET